MVTVAMIRRDGKMIPVDPHWYVDPDDLEYTIDFAEDLYKATAEQTTKSLILEAIAYYNKERDPEYLKTVISRELIQKAKDTVKTYRDESTLIKLLNNAVNQEFLRYRFGGAYDTAEGSSDVYFRVSSTGFDWFSIIYEFVYKHANQISTVTVIRDPESTGTNGQYYNIGGQAADHMPIEDFITAKGRPVIDSWIYTGHNIHR